MTSAVVCSDLTLRCLLRSSYFTSYAHHYAMVHQVLQTTELVTLICSFATQSSHARLARTCRTFLVPALDALWESTTASELLSRILPGVLDIVQIPDTKSYQVNFVSPVLFPRNHGTTDNSSTGSNTNRYRMGQTRLLRRPDKAPQGRAPCRLD